jgi:NOL1/NOP2/fmu family ribosome biogenesis protein
MINLKILNKKSIKEILKIIKEQWDAELDLREKAVLMNKENDIFIINKSISQIDLSKIRANSIGLYVAQKMVDGIRLSIEGSQLVGPLSRKNIFEVDDEQAKKWLKGEDIEINKNFGGFLIIKHKEDFLGCGKVKENKILNYVPKNRRLKVSD